MGLHLAGPETPEMASLTCLAPWVGWLEGQGADRASPSPLRLSSFSLLA